MIRMMGAWKLAYSNNIYIQYKEKRDFSPSEQKPKVVIGKRRSFLTGLQSADLIHRKWTSAEHKDILRI